MLSAAQNIDICVKDIDYIIADKKIGIKRMDQLLFTRSSYGIACAARKEFDDGNISEENLRFHCGLKVSVGRISYAELPLMYDVILGVTGTLKTLTSDESQILKDHYDVSNISLIPSIYGKNKLLFAGDNVRGMYAI